MENYDGISNSHQAENADRSLDLNTFNRLFGRYYPRMLRFATGYVADRVVAEDIVMESFSVAWNKRDSLTDQSFAPYILTVIRNRSLNHLRALEVRARAAEQLHSHQQRILQTRIATLEACDPQELFSNEARMLVERTLANLPQRTRDIFLRSRVHGQSYKQIAAETDSSVKSVEFEISKAMKMLRKALKDYLPYFIFWFCN